MFCVHIFQIINVYVHIPLSHTRLTMYYIRPFLYDIITVIRDLVNVTLQSVLVLVLVTVRTVLMLLQSQILPHQYILYCNQYTHLVTLTKS